MTPKQKIINYLNYKHISQDKFARDINVSGSFLRQGKAFSIDILPKIRNKYTDLNLNWLIYDEGSMILDTENVVNEQVAIYNTRSECEKKYLSVIEKLSETQEKLIVANEKIIELIGSNQQIKKDKPIEVSS